MTSYASRPTPDWSASGPLSPVPPAPGDAPPGDDQESAPGGEWQTGPIAGWRTAVGERGQDEAADPQPGLAAAQVPAVGQVPARELWTGSLRDQARGAAGRGMTGRGMTDRGMTDRGMTDRGMTDRGMTDRGMTDRGMTDRGDRHGRRAVLSYISVPFLGFLVPLAVYLITPRTSVLSRRHAAQALNLSITVVLYDICALILGGLLALDTVMVGVLVTVVLLAALWLTALVYLVLAGTAASRGDYYRIPGWLCATLLR
jgi:uncharacterized Tic20 family protein